MPQITRVIFSHALESVNKVTAALDEVDGKSRRDKPRYHTDVEI